MREENTPQETGMEMIAAERTRQQDMEGYDAQHDADHRNGSLVKAAICYAARAINIRVWRKIETKFDGSIKFIDPWPWAWANDKRKKHDEVQCLAIAGALIAAEIDRRLHAEENPDADV